MHDERPVDRILGQRWEEYARRRLALTGQGHPGRDTVVELFGEPDPFEVVVAPFDDRWPGIAGPAAPTRTDPDRLAAGMLDALARAERARGDGSSGVLAQAGRSTDVPALARRHDLPEPWESDPAELSAVLRSWEERFGTRLVLLERERLILSVAAPPSTTDAAQAVAAENFAFAPDTITQGDHETLRPYAAHEVLGRRMWSFWWD